MRAGVAKVVAEKPGGRAKGTDGGGEEGGGEDCEGVEEGQRGGMGRRGKRGRWGEKGRKEMGGREEGRGWMGESKVSDVDRIVAQQRSGEQSIRFIAVVPHLADLEHLLTVVRLGRTRGRTVGPREDWKTVHAVPDVVGVGRHVFRRVVVGEEVVGREGDLVCVTTGGRA